MEPEHPRAKKSLGQHWLDDPVSLEAMCLSAEVGTDDVVVEIGPGTGELTEKLLASGAHVIALEIDQTLVPQLQERFTKYGEHFTLETADIRTYDLSTLPNGYKITANIPYYLTSHLLRILSESNNPPQKAALLVQKEVAERAAAEPGDMSLLSVTVQFYWDVSLGAIVPADLFVPPPKVDSQILVLTRRDAPLYDVDEKQFFRVVKAGFSARRKKLRSSLAGGLRTDKKAVEAVLSKVGIDPDARAQALSLNEWHKLYQAVKQQQIIE